MNCAIGIDVGGEKKGFAVAALMLGTRELLFMEGAADVESTVRRLRQGGLKPRVIAIDSPPRAQLDGEKSRASERQLHAKGYRVQWTRRQGKDPPEWMLNGQLLWESLSREFPELVLIETFPAVAFDNLCDFQFRPCLRPEGVSRRRAHHHDLMDAALCAMVAVKFVEGAAQVVGDARSGEIDELGPIYF